MQILHSKSLPNCGEQLPNASASEVQILGKAAQNYYQINTRHAICLCAKGPRWLWAALENQGPEGEGMSPKSHKKQTSCSLLPQELWVLNSGGRRRQCAPTLKACSADPSTGVESLMGALWKARAHRSPTWERMAAACLRRGEAGVEPGWQRKHLEKQAGGREEE